MERRAFNFRAEPQVVFVVLFEQKVDAERFVALHGHLASPRKRVNDIASERCVMTAQSLVCLHHIRRSELFQRGLTDFFFALFELHVVVNAVHALVVRPDLLFDLRRRENVCGTVQFYVCRRSTGFAARDAADTAPERLKRC